MEHKVDILLLLGTSLLTGIFTGGYLIIDGTVFPFILMALGMATGITLTNVVLHTKPTYDEDEE